MFLISFTAALLQTFVLRLIFIKQTFKVLNERGICVCVVSLVLAFTHKCTLKRRTPTRDGRVITLFCGVSKLIQ